MAFYPYGTLGVECRRLRQSRTELKMDKRSHFVHRQETPDKRHQVKLSLAPFHKLRACLEPEFALYADREPYSSRGKAPRDSELGVYFVHRYTTPGYGGTHWLYVPVMYTASPFPS